MSLYLDSFSPEANLGDVFQDLNERAGHAIAEEASLLSSDRTTLTPPGTDLRLRFVTGEASVEERRPATASIIAFAIETKGEAPMVLLAKRSRAKSLEEDPSYEAASVAAAGKDGWFPTYSVERNPVGLVVSRQLAAPGGAELRLGKSPAGTSNASNGKELESLGVGYRNRLSIVSSVVVRNLRIIELMKEGRTLKQAFRALEDRPS